MAAQRDNTQAIRFHYGLAYRDLANQLPDDDQHQQQSPEAIVDQCIASLDDVLATRATLHFVLKDIKLLMG
jgi:hypothetical protein